MTSAAVLHELFVARQRVVAEIETGSIDLAHYQHLGLIDAEILYLVAENHGTRLYDDASGTA